jgi:Putative beta-barrel porin 2
VRTDVILPCRIHHSRKRVNFLLALLFAISLLAPVLQGTAQDTSGSSEEAGPTFFSLVPLQITAGADIGYDDNVIGGGTSASGQTSLFARENLVLNYDRLTQRTEVQLLGVGRFTQYFDLGTDDKNGNITLSLTHKASTRLIFYSSAYAAYQTEPDFASNVGLENVRADHFFTNDTFWVVYYWLPRFATVTSYNFQRIKYTQSAGASQASQADQDRMGNTFDEQLLFALTSRTNLIGTYRFQIMDYDTAPRDSVTHYALAGINHHLTEHLVVHALGGELFRSFKNDGDTIDPYAEGTLAYESSNHSLEWTTSYRVEEPTATNAQFRTTIRTGVRLNYDLTSRITSTTGVYYHHDDNEAETSSGFSSVGTQDSFQLTLGLRYTINKHFALHVDYEHWSVSSLGSTPGYSRNRYFGGLTYTY